MFISLYISMFISMFINFISMFISMFKNISTTRTDSLPADLRKKASIVEDVNPFVEFPSLRSVAEWLLVEWRFYVDRVDTTHTNTHN